MKEMNHANKDAATSLLFSWTDTKLARPAQSAMYAILNDTERRLNTDLVTALEHYDVQTVPWTKRQEYAAKRAALRGPWGPPSRLPALSQITPPPGNADL